MLNTFGVWRCRVAAVPCTFRGSGWAHSRPFESPPPVCAMSVQGRWLTPLNVELAGACSRCLRKPENSTPAVPDHGDFTFGLEQRD